MQITFLPENIIQEIQVGQSILDGAALAKVDVDGNCAGAGTCGKCKVRVLEGNDFKPDKHEEERLTKRELENGYRLACRFFPTQEVSVEVPLAQGAADRKTKLVQMPDWFVSANQFSGKEGRFFGAAFDIGTTTVVGMLWDLAAGKNMGTVALTNPQGVHGADVISRIMYAGESKENLETIHNKIMDCINEIIELFETRYQVARHEIYKVTVVGNTTMSHLFMGVDPSSLAVAPFLPVFLAGICENAVKRGIRVREEAELYLMANMAGHVGSDITSGLIATDIANQEKITLQIDIGTNGEIALTGKGRQLVCSTAAGPAFEGASIFQGMRAAAGAIEKVTITKDQVEIKTIEDASPVGICGSGIIDAVAQLIDNGMVEATGRFAKPETLLERGFAPDVAQRMRSGQKGKEFVLEYVEGGEDLVILQKDIREVQLAKAAIYAGIKILMNQLDVTPETIDNINIAGAFGSYIQIESALSIGLLPNIDINKISSVGNAAGIGASMALLSDEKKQYAEELAKNITHVELSTCLEFQDEYIAAMKF